VRLFCKSPLADPVFTWYKDGFDLNVNTTLLTTTLLAHDGSGEYWCNDGSMSKNQITIKSFSMIITAVFFFSFYFSSRG